MPTPAEKLSVSPEVERAAERTEALARSLSDTRRDALLKAWGDALDDLEEATSARATERVLTKYWEGVEAQLSAPFAHLPLKRVG